MRLSHEIFFLGEENFSAYRIVKWSLCATELNIHSSQHTKKVKYSHFLHFKLLLWATEERGGFNLSPVCLCSFNDKYHPKNHTQLNF